MNIMNIGILRLKMMHMCEPICAYTICVQVPIVARIGGQVTGAAITKHSYKMPNMSPLEKHQVLVTTEQSFQLFMGIFK